MTPSFIFHLRELWHLLFTVLKSASSIIQILIFKPCFGKCILCGTSVINYALLSATIVYNTPQASTGWKHIYYRQWCQCWSVLIGRLRTKARQKGICFQWLVRLVLEVTSWCLSPNVGIQLPVLRVPFHSRTASLEASWWSWFGAISSTDLASHSLCRQVFTLSH